MNKTKLKQTEIGEIPEGWDVRAITDLPIDIIDGDRGINYPKKNEFEKQGFCLFLNTKNVPGEHFDFSECDFISEERDQILRKGKLQKGDIVLTTRGTVGNVAYYHERIPYEHIRINSGMVIIRNTRKRFDTDYLYHLLKSPTLKQQYLSFSTGSAQPQLPIRDINKIRLTIPSVLEQRAIAKILSNLDEKIELNNQMNKTLEAIGQTLFKRWFVDEDKDATSGKLGDILDVIESGSRPKGGIDPSLLEGIPSIGAENIDGIGFYDYSKTKYVPTDFFNTINRGIVKDYDVLVYKDGAYIGRKSMFGKGFPYEKCCVNEHVFILRSNSRANQFFLFFLLNQDELRQLNTNSAQPGLNQESVRSWCISIPAKIKIDRFGETVKPLVDGIFYNCNQSRILSQIRDSLLPRLMSGKIRVQN